jgi:tRNA (guanine-N7-)-methyltransferase
MDPSGRPTTARPTDQQIEADGWGFHDRLPAEVARPEFNPYLLAHREFGRPLVPADEAQRWRGRWAEFFGRDAPLHVEIGSGNGFFLSGLAKQHPEWNIIGLEIRYKRVMLCAKKLREAGAEHAIIARYHAGYLHDLFEPGTLAGLYVNHPDPWPKERHEKNRLISRWFLEDVVTLLRPGAKLQVKSDFEPNCGRIVELLAPGAEGGPLPLQITGRADDVNNTGAPWPDDICTNYQRKMRERGVPVHAIEVVRTADLTAPADTAQ